MAFSRALRTPTPRNSTDLQFGQRADIIQVSRFFSLKCWFSTMIRFPSRLDFGKRPRTLARGIPGPAPVLRDWHHGRL